MREIPPLITEAWEAGDFIGNRRPTARVTIQQANIEEIDFGYNVYTTLPFGGKSTPKELPNVSSVSWSRDAERPRQPSSHRRGCALC